MTTPIFSLSQAALSWVMDHEQTPYQEDIKSLEDLLLRVWDMALEHARSDGVHLGLEEHARLAEHQKRELQEARDALAWVRNRQLDANATNACAGTWDTCWCDDCEKRRLLKKSGRLFTNYEVFSLSLDEVKAWLATPTDRTHCVFCALTKDCPRHPSSDEELAAEGQKKT